MRGDIGWGATMGVCFAVAAPGVSFAQISAPSATAREEPRQPSAEEPNAEEPSAPDKPRQPSAPGGPAADRGSFDAGVAAARAGRWEDAARHFAAAAAADARPSVVFNLVVAYAHLGRDPELLSAADRFAEVTDPNRHAAYRAETERLRARALRRVGLVRLRLPSADPEVQVDGRLVVGAGTERNLYLPPGAHRITVAGDSGERTYRVDVGPGTRLELQVPDARPSPPTSDASTSDASARNLPNAKGGRTDAAGPPAPGAPSIQAARPHRAQSAAPKGDPPGEFIVASAVSLGLGAGLYALAGVFQAMAWQHADRVRARAPEQAGFLSLSNTYLDLSALSVYASVGGALFTIAAEALYPFAPDALPPWWLTLIGGAALVPGVALLVRTPERLGESQLDDPGTSLGAGLVALGAPFLLSPLTVYLQQTLIVRPGPGQAGLSVEGAF